MLFRSPLPTVRVLDKTKSGTVHLKWSRVECRFNGTWGKGADRSGTMSLRMVDKEIRGGFTTDEEVQLETGTPLVGDLLWRRSHEPNDKAITNVRYDVSELIGGATNEQADSELRQLCSLIAETIEPESWKGDEFIIVPFAQNSSIVVRQTGARHAAIRDFLKQLRELNDKAITNVRYDVSELIGGATNEQADSELKQLCSLIVETIEPNSWKEGEFRIGIAPYTGNSSIVVRQTGACHAAIRDLLKQLRELKHRETANTAADNQEPLDRQNARAVVEAFVAAAISGRIDEAASLVDQTELSAEDRPAFPEAIEVFFRQFNVQQPAMKSVYVNDPAIPTMALAISEAVKLARKQADGQRDSFLVVRLTMSEGGWLLTDDELEWEESADRELKKFLEANPRSISVPPQAASETAKSATGLAESPPNTKMSMPTRVKHFTTGDGKKIACSPDGKLIAVANGGKALPVAEGWKRTVEILDAETGDTAVSISLTTQDEDALLATTEGPRDFDFDVGSLAFSPDGTLLAVGTGLGQVKLFDSRTGKLVLSLDDEPAKLAVPWNPGKLRSLKRAMGSIGSLAFSPDGKRLAMSGRSFADAAPNWAGVRELGRLATGPGRLKVWEVKTGVLIHDLAGHSHANAVSFSPDGSLLASTGQWSGENGTGVIIWNAGTGTQLHTFTNEANGGTHAVVFSPTGNLVAIGSRHFDKANDTSTTTVSLAHAMSGITEWEQTVSGWGHPVAFSPDGKSVGVLCGGEAIRLLLFDTVTGAVKHNIGLADPSQGARWNDFALLPQGRLAIAGVDNARQGKVEIWDFTGPNPISISVPPQREAQPRAAHVNLLVGHWKLVKLADMPVDQLAGATVVIDEHRVKMHVPSQKGPHPDWRYTLGANGDIDLVDADDVKGESIVRAKYSLHGNTLYLALNAKKGDHPRPESATGEVPQEGVHYIVLESDEEAKSSEAAKAPDAGRGTREGHPQASEQSALSKTLKQLQGKWHLTRQIAADGDEEGTPGRSIWEFKGDRIIVRDGGPGGAMLIQVDESQSPVHVDLLIETDEESGLGLLSVEGDTLILCLGKSQNTPAPESRPEKLQWVSGVWYMELRRLKPGETIVPLKPKSQPQPQEALSPRASPVPPSRSPVADNPGTTSPYATTSELDQAPASKSGPVSDRVRAKLEALFQ